MCRFLPEKPEGRRPLGRPRRRCMENIRTDVQEVGCGYMDWIGLAQDRDRWRTLVSAVMNLRVPWNAGYFLTSCKPVSFSRRILQHGVSKSRNSPSSYKNKNVHYLIHNSSSLVAVMSQMYTVFDLFCLTKFHFNIILLTGPILLCGSFHSDLVYIKFFLRLPQPLQRYMPRPSRHTNDILSGMNITEFSIMQPSLSSVYCCLVFRVSCEYIYLL